MTTFVKLRLIVPRKQRGCLSIADSIRLFFAQFGESVCEDQRFTNLAFLPTVLEGQVAYETYEFFLRNYEHINRLTISATVIDSRSVIAAAA